MAEIETVLGACQESKGYFFKYISANDVGKTGTHQSGFYMPNSVWPLFFSEEGKDGENKDVYITIKWDYDFETDSRFVWYGKGTRSEYRLTRGITFLEPENVGDVLVFTKKDKKFYEAFVLSNDDDIDNYLDSLGLSPNDAYRLQKPDQFSLDQKLILLFREWLEKIKVDFPKSKIVSRTARDMWGNLNSNQSKSNYDKLLLDWLDTEFKLFKFIERDRYSEYLESKFKTVDDLVSVANTILNRRKSRAGHSLENHLQQIFTTERIPYSAQGTTEGRKKPDFIFPNIEAYHDSSFAGKDLYFLAAKTTCKDRWRQILNEADRIPIKHLITLQQGISEYQLKEMWKHDVRLIVPKRYIKSFPKGYRKKIMDLESYLFFLNNNLESTRDLFTTET